MNPKTPLPPIPDSPLFERRGNDWWFKPFVGGWRMTLDEYTPEVRLAIALCAEAECWVRYNSQSQYWKIASLAWGRIAHQIRQEIQERNNREGAS